MSTSKLAVVVDATIAALRTVLPATCPVFDGPMVVDGSLQQWCVVGGDGAEDTEAGGGQFTQTWADIGAVTRDEQIDIPCALVAWVGDESPFKTVRDMVVGNLALLETNLLANIQEGITADVQWVQLTSGELFYRNTTSGIGARLPFTIHVYSQI